MAHRGVFLASAALLVGVIRLEATFARAAAQTEEISIVGCLQRGMDSEEYELVTDDKNILVVEAAAGLDVVSHVSRRVQLTGRIEQTDTRTILKARALKMISTSCQAERNRRGN